MAFKSILKKLDFVSECRKYGLGFWQCPNSLFLVMGIIIIVAMILTYFIGINFVEPEVVIIIVSAVTIVLLIIGHSLVNSFTRIAEANRMKSEFVSIVSHQLRTPLSALKWSLDLLRSKRLGDITAKQKEYIDIINESSNKMIKLVNDLLNVTRIEQGKLLIQAKAFTIEDLIEETIKEINMLAQAHNVQIKYKNNKKLPNTYADPDRIRMVIENLIDNAIKYSKKEGGWVNIEAKIDPEHRGMIRIDVKDNGVGISDLLKDQVFGKFFRGDSLVTQKVEGTGLGLFIARGIIKISKGEMNFESEENKGSNFWFTLPIANKINKKTTDK